MAIFTSAKADTINALIREGVIKSGADADAIAEFEKLSKRYGREASEEGMEDGPDLKASKWALSEAADRMRMKAGKTAAPAPAPTPAAPKPAVRTEAQARADRAVDRSALPPSLAGAPLAADATVAGDKFAHIDRLPRMDQERAVAALSPAEEAEYLAR